MLDSFRLGITQQFNQYVVNLLALFKKIKIK